MEIRNELKQVLKKLRLSGILALPPERAAYARGVKLTHEDFLEPILSDEVERRRAGAWRCISRTPSCPGSDP